MSRAPADLAASLRPTVVDYFFLLLGASLSLLLFQIGTPLKAEPGPAVPEPLADLFAVLPEPLRLTEGIVLMWPFLYGTQRLRGRSQTLTSAEWLWVVSWLGVALLTAISLTERYGRLPEFVEPHASQPRQLWYLIFVPCMAALALLRMLTGLFRRGPVPWTHSLALALLLWPVLPLTAILALGKFV
jgi:hypothetical protein